MNLSVMLSDFTEAPILVTHSEGLYWEQKIVGCTSSLRSTSSNMKLMSCSSGTSFSHSSMTSAFCAARRSLMRYQRSDGVPSVGSRSGILASCDCHVVVFCHPLEKRV